MDQGSEVREPRDPCVGIFKAHLRTFFCAILTQGVVLIR